MITKGGKGHEDLRREASDRGGANENSKRKRETILWKRGLFQRHSLKTRIFCLL
jgi:hypothetical protein